MDILNSIFPAAVIYTIPLLLGALGALYSERSGVTNLCIEGFMLMGCFSCAVTMVNLQGKIPMTFCFIIGMLVAAAVTAVYSLLHAVAAINLRADQVISGTALNMMSTALTVYLAQTVTGSGNITIAHSIVPFAVAKIFSESFYALLWTYIFAFVVFLIVRQCFSFAKKKAQFNAFFGRTSLRLYALLLVVPSLILSLFIPSPVIAGCAGIIIASVLSVLVWKKENFLSSIRFVEKVRAEKQTRQTYLTLAVIALASCILAKAGLGTFLRGMAFERVYWTTIVGLAIWALSYLLLYKTSFGLRLRACGEHPSAVASAGVNVHRMRYIGVVASGALAGLGGAVYLITVGGEFNSASGMNGLGFLAVAGLIFGQWKVVGILGSTFFFGFCYTIANMSRVIPALAVVPPGIFSAFPYVATLIVLIFTSKRNVAPLATGQPY